MTSMNLVYRVPYSQLPSRASPYVPPPPNPEPICLHHLDQDNYTVGDIEGNW